MIILFVTSELNYFSDTAFLDIAPTQQPLKQTKNCYNMAINIKYNFCWLN